MTRNRTTFVLTIINLILLTAILVQGKILSTQTIPDVLSVRSLQLVDEHGEVRARLDVEETSGEVILRLMDQQGTIRVKLGASETGSGLLLLNDLTQPGIHILAQEDTTSLSLTDQDGMREIIEP